MSEEGPTIAELSPELAAESDDLFIQRIRAYFKMLTPQLRDDADQVMRQLSRPGSKNSLRGVVFIPISHDPTALEVDVAVGQEVRSIFEAEAGRLDLVASGEHVASPFTPTIAAESVERGLRRLIETRILHLSEETLHWRLAWHAGFEVALLGFLEAHPEIRGEGVDNGLAVFVGNTFRYRPSVVQARGGEYGAAELEHRFLIEARTRYALQRCRSLAPDGGRVALVLGQAHRAGVIAWCDRNHTEYVERRPPSLPVSL